MGKYLILTRFLLLVQSVIWIVLSLAGFLIIIGKFNIFVAAYSLAMLVNGLVFVFLYNRIISKKKRYFYFTLLYLAANLVLAAADQWGIFDAVILLLNIGNMVLLIMAKKDFSLLPAVIPPKAE